MYFNHGEFPEEQGEQGEVWDLEAIIGFWCDREIETPNEHPTEYVPMDDYLEKELEREREEELAEMVDDRIP
jgi:hypothetical protein